MSQDAVMFWAQNNEQHLWMANLQSSLHISQDLEMLF